jgi:chlorite dismutase
MHPTANLDDQPAASRCPVEGWHVAHYFYSFERQRLRQLTDAEKQAGQMAFCQGLVADADAAPARLQTSIVSGHKADFAVLAMDADPFVVDAVHQRLMAGPLGPSIRARYSFISLTEVSEYVPTIEQYVARLTTNGLAVDSEVGQSRIKAYSARIPEMRRQRLTPDLPNWPAMCFYPMNKKREVGENWFLLPLEVRSSLMAEHARSGMTFAGKVSQLITVGVGLDDWEWGVTLWARNPRFLTDIVYRMRFDEASARYAQFGPFYVSYLASPQEILEHCRVGQEAWKG